MNGFVRERLARAQAPNYMEPLRDASTVIQCPSCHTKFAVESSQIESYELPRFHCSRCDHVFSFDDGPAPKVEQFQETVQPSIAIPRSLDRNFSSVPPHENLGDDGASLTSRIEKFENEETEQMAFDFAAPKQTTSVQAKSSALWEERPERLPELTPYKGEDIIIRRPEEPPQQPRTRVSPFEIPKPQPLQSSLASGAAISAVQARKEITPWGGLLYIIAPIFGFLAALFLISLLIASDPSGIGASASLTLAPSSPAAPPPELFVASASYEEVTLDNGEILPVVSGRIQNRSGETFKDAMIEAILFDKEGKEILTSRSVASSPLIRTRIKALSPEMIKNLQTSGRNRKFALKPGDGSDFVMVLFGEGAEKAASYLVRIYSVTK